VQSHGFGPDSTACGQGLSRAYRFHR
jgi:hypothetical protein